MRATLVSLRPAETAADRPSLTPELLAASGARYSRNNEGLEAILAKIDPENLDKSVDSIFRMIDYGHQSIADMAPVAIFIDGISLILAYKLWARCPTAGGQESSTRYIQLTQEGALSAEAIGLPESLRNEHERMIGDAFSAYEQALAFWGWLAEERPDLIRAPEGLSPKAVERIKRNYAFDRARYFLPVASKTNVMLAMSARAWAQLCQRLNSHYLAEARQLGELLRNELALATPRLVKHAGETHSYKMGAQYELDCWVNEAIHFVPERICRSEYETDEPPMAMMDVYPPHEMPNYAADLAHHGNRYDWVGPDLRRTGLRYGWSAVAFGEIRDLNRHRTGARYCPLIPRGFYWASDQIPKGVDPSPIRKLAETGREAAKRCYELLRDGEHTFGYWPTLGVQFFFERLTTADKFVYEAELRTGAGAHFRYARHYTDALRLFYEWFPETKGLILEGSAEPE
ncbi:MAG: FAD-dependent thymidylate synthase [Armatimonadetes bacterium]|nr:FAD-dependent thymidylate synthase [Armatimonadota bacterium]